MFSGEFCKYQKVHDLASFVANMLLELQTVNHSDGTHWANFHLAIALLQYLVAEIDNR